MCQKLLKTTFILHSTKSGHDLVLFFWKFYDNLRLLLLHQGEHCCKFCICSCYCLVCCRMTCIKSWCCFLDCSSFLLSASSRRFCSCISSISHFCMRSFFSRKYATVSLPPLRRFALVAVSFSTSSFLCIFCVPPRFSFPLLWHYRVSFCHFALFLQPQLLFLLSPQVLFQRHPNLYLFRSKA